MLVAAGIWAASPPPILADATAPGTEIENIAYSEAELPVVTGEGGSALVTFQSNRVITVVAPLFDIELRLEVLPATTVAPGTLLTYRLHYENFGTGPITAMVLRLPLDPQLPSPDGFTGGPGEPTIPPVLSAAYDSLAHEVSWDLADLDPGDQGFVDVRVPVDPASPEDTVLLEQAIGSSPDLPADATSNTVQVNVLDPVLTLTKVVDRQAAEVGDSVGYRLLLGNTSQSTPLQSVLVSDLLPPGFRYAEGTVRLDGLEIPEPVVSGEGRQLTFAVGTLAPGAEALLTYRARVGPGAERGDGVNTASARGSSAAGAVLGTGTARAGVRVTAGLFSGESVIIGRVYVDADEDGQPSPGDPGVPGVRLLLEDGTYVLTDIVGKYHLEGIRRGLHVLRLDGNTLPPGLRPAARGVRSGGDSDSLFIDLGPDELYKANFAVRPVGGGDYPHLAVRFGDAPDAVLPLSPEIFAGGSDAGGNFDVWVEQLGRYLRHLGRAPARVRVEADPGLPDGLAGTLQEALSSALGVPGGEGLSPENLEDEDPEAAKKAADEVIRRMPATMAFLDPIDGGAVKSSRTDVTVRVPLPAEPRLEVNGTPIPATQIGTTRTWERGRVGVYTYVNVGLREGRNVLTLRSSAGGAPLGIEVFRSGPPASIVVAAEPTPADGITEARARVRVLDLSGNPVQDGTVATVEVDKGGIGGIDADPAREGFQVRMRGGEAWIRLPPAAAVGERRVVVTSGLASTEGLVRYVARAEKWVVSGVAEISVGGDAVGGLAEIDGPLVGDEEDPLVDGRAAFFARGSVADDHVLTFAYDSERRREQERLFQEIDPERFFPAYGDSSRQAYAAETSGKLFARWEHLDSSALWGDFDTALDGGELTRYDRRFHGMRTDLTFGGFGLQAFAADTPHTIVQDEIPGAGVSGPYVLKLRPIVANSERLAIEIRDRFHSERVLLRTELTRYVDYDIDYVLGTILFKEPVAAADAAFNPVMIVAIYETDDAGASHLVYGGRAGYRMNGAFEVGGTFVVEDHEAGNFTLAGMDLTWRPMPGMRVRTEYGRTEDVLGVSGGAFVVDTSWNIGGRAEVRGYFRNLGIGYRNPSRSGAQEEGTRKYGVEGRADLSAGLRVRGAAFSQESLLTGVRSQVIEGGVEKDFGKVLANGGLRYTHQMGGGLPSVSVPMVYAGARVHVAKEVDVILERDQALSSENLGLYPTRTRAGVEYRLPDGSKAFVHQEFEEGDGPTATRTLAGVETRLSDHTTVTGQYTLEDSIAGQANRANLGLRTRLPISRLWTAQLFGERVATLEGDSSGDFTALGAGFEYLPEGVKFSGRFETRFGEADTQYLLTAAGALKLGARYTLFAREVLSIFDPDEGPRDTDHDLLTGVAFRPVATDRFNWLARFELGGEGGSSTIGAPESNRIGGVFQLNVEPAVGWQLTAKLAARHVREQDEGIDLSTLTGLAQFRLGRDLGRRWNVGGAVRLLAQPESEIRETGLGVEAGFMVFKDLWLVLGYNITGYADGLYADADATEQGPYLAMRFKFDENTLRGVTGPEGRP